MVSMMVVLVANRNVIMNKLKHYLSLGLFVLLFSACSNDDKESCPEPVYPLDNNWEYTCGDDDNYCRFIFYGKNVNVKVVTPERVHASICSYTYVHPIVTFTYSDYKQYQLIVREKELVYKDESGKEYIFQGYDLNPWN